MKKFSTKNFSDFKLKLGYHKDSKLTQMTFPGKVFFFFEVFE